MKINRKLHRSIGIGVVKAADESNCDVMEFSFSSEAPIERWFGEETLSHDSGAPDFSRLNDGANLLWNHNPDAVLGVIEKAYIGADKRGYTQIKWGTSSVAQEKKREVEAGIIRNVSFGYQIEDMTQVNPGVKNENPKFLATKWMPYEISFVSIPADQSVGVGRSEEETERVGEHEAAILNKIKREIGKMSEETEKQKLEAAQKAAIESARKEAAESERVRSTGISALGEKFGKKDLARQLVESGKSLDEARAAFIEAIGGKQIALKGNEGELGLSEKEKRSYSWIKAMNFLANPHDRKARDAAAFEIEVSTAAADKSGRASRGLTVPVDMLNFKRDLTVGTSTAGGNTVATILEAGSFIELLRNRSVMQKAGATVLNGLVGNIAIPKQTGADTAYWVAESGSPTETAQTIGQVSMTPKTVGAFTDYSRKLLLQSSIDVENFVRADLATVIALEIDRVAMYGTGSSNQPQGLKATLAGGAQEKNFAAATPTFAEVISMETAVTSANADVSAMRYIVGASMAGSLKSAVKVSGYPIYILDNGAMNGYPVLVSNQVASGDVLFGAWDQLLMCFWSGLDLMVDPYSQSSSGTVRIVALQDCDIAVRHAESFSRGNDNP